MVGQVWEVVGGADKGGIIVRSGAGTKSPELPRRLSTGALVRELELQGDRLRFLRLSGDGPLCGWVSLKVKDKDLLTKSAAAGPPEEAKAEVLERPYSIIVFGATGYTGGLICEHLDAMLSRAGAEKHSWAIAGRNLGRLQELSGKLKTKPGTVVAESEEQIAAMVAQCRVILNAAGPYAVCGEPVVRACLASGTDYLDITGEVYWVRQMIDQYDSAAKDKDVALVNMCGQDSVPPDLTVNLLVQHLGPLKQVRAYMFQAGTLSGGTHQTGLTSWGVNPEKAFAAQQDPFHLGGLRKGGVRPVDQDCTAPEQCPLFPKLWLAPAGTGLPDSRCVRRSCGLFDDERDSLKYGEDFALIYREGAQAKSSAMEMLRACGPVPAPAFAPKMCEYMTDAVQNGHVAKPGGGAPAATRQYYFSKIIATAEAEDGRWAYCEHTAPESYEVTAICSVAAALVLCEERGALRAMDRRGFLTPAFAFLGTSFLQRLRASPFADAYARTMDWKVKDGKPPEELLTAAVQQRTKAMVEVMSKIQDGELKRF